MRSSGVASVGCDGTDRVVGGHLGRSAPAPEAPATGVSWAGSLALTHQNTSSRGRADALVSRALALNDRADKSCICTILSRVAVGAASIVLLARSPVPRGATPPTGLFSSRPFESA